MLADDVYTIFMNNNDVRFYNTVCISKKMMYCICYAFRDVELISSRTFYLDRTIVVAVEKSTVCFSV